MTALMASQQNHSKIVLKGELGADIDAWLPKGSTLKETTAIFSNEVCSMSTAMSLRTLSDHVYTHIRNHYLYLILYLLESSLENRD
jgi:hypothetical protein